MRRCAVVTRIGWLLGVLTGAALAVGVVSWSSIAAVAQRTWPVLLFALAITVVADNSARAGVFTSLADRLARIARGRRAALFALAVVLAVVSTTFLSLDTTAVLLTPVMIVLARGTGSPVLPFAFATVWIANTASLSLPVSNLTNLLAAHRLGNPSPLTWLGELWLPSLAAIAVTALALAVVGRKGLGGVYEADTVVPPPDVVLWRTAVAVLALVIPALVLPVAPWIPASIAAAVLVIVAKIRKRSGAPYRTWWRDAPWSLLVFASGLFLAGGVLDEAVLPRLAIPTLPAGGLGALIAAGAGMVLANMVDNLPAYLTLESLTQGDFHLRAVLIGVNVGPLITPWGSLATLLWHRQLGTLDVDVPWRKYVLWSAVVAPLAVGAATLALVVAA